MSENNALTMKDYMITYINKIFRTRSVELDGSVMPLVLIRLTVV